MQNQIRPVGILGTGSYLPPKIMTNHDIEQIVDTSDEWIVARTGIKGRHIADENTATAHLATKAAKLALEDAKVLPEEIDLIIVATVTPDMLFPSTACIVQKEIKAINAAAFDLAAGCSGFLYGLSVAKQFIATGMYQRVLVIGAETLSKILDWKDRNTCVLFGDGAGAAVLGPTEEGFGILSSTMGADGEGGKFLTMPAGGSLMPASIETIEQRLHYLKMDGSEVFKFAARTMPKASIEALNLSGYNIDDVDCLIPHQANIRIIKSAAKKLNLPMEKIFVNLDKVGNMSAASIPVALDEAVKQSKIKKGDLIVLVGFGAGLTWGSNVIRWNK
ncbi:beta-ketoacyl-ACP synthase III [Inediibacterium massiliense]|uniref:beta-ketoacyl-ACP synthase III n=1 Tax=Inediibacterium massiliense TaxID=1658111 RepID=UPI0006B41C03|nr:beta-ketoacyl-ACP synthase III [Inediibacterium massiliense]